MGNGRTILRHGCTAIMLLGIGASLLSADLEWAGHSWNVTSGGMAGDIPATPANVVVDDQGYLHLKITNDGSWRGAELFSTENLGFGTYQWQIDAPVDKLDKNIVLGLYPYGPAAGIGGDGTNEIDIEYARWGNDAWPNGNYTVYPNSGSKIGETTFEFALNGTLTTSTFVWSSEKISYLTQEGIKELGDNSDPIKTWEYAPTNPTTNIPQRAMPLGMNLWICSECGGQPSDGQQVDVVIRSFRFVPEGETAAKSQAVKFDAAMPLLFSQRNGATVMRLARPADHELSVQVMDVAGRLVRTDRLAANACELSLTGLSAGVHVVKVGTGEFAPMRNG
jgi:hypothetical protein